MGWNSANEIVDPQIRTMAKAVENDEMPVSLASKMLVQLIKDCQQGDWDTEDESLEEFAHLPWVRDAFANCGITQSVQDVDDLKKIVRQVIDANVESWYDLSEDFARNHYAEKIAEAVAPFLSED